MKVLVDLLNINHILNNVSYLIGLENFSYNISKEFSLSNVIEYINTLKHKNISVGVNLEKIMFDNDLDLLLPILIKLEQCNVDFITYSDLGVYQLIKENHLNIKVIYHSTTMITNLEDIDLMLEENDNIILGKEISFEELKYIDKNLPKKVYIDAFGKFPIFYSRRKLLSTYFEYRKMNENPHDLDYTLIEEFRKEPYPIVEKDGTTVYDTAYYCLGDEIKELLNVSKVYLSSNFLDEETYEKIVNIYLEGNNIEENLSKIVNIYKGKLEEKTILIKGGNN